MSQHKTGVSLIPPFSVNEFERAFIIIVHVPFVTIVDMRFGVFVDPCPLDRFSVLIYHITCSVGKECSEDIEIIRLDVNVLTHETGECENFAGLYPSILK